jgi:hypothetical protein
MSTIMLLPEVLKSPISSPASAKVPPGKATMRLRRLGAQHLASLASDHPGVSVLREIRSLWEKRAGCTRTAPASSS